jgi:hypothetical protein
MGAWRVDVVNEEDRLCAARGNDVNVEEEVRLIYLNHGCAHRNDLDATDEEAVLGQTLSSSMERKGCARRLNISSEPLRIESLLGVAHARQRSVQAFLPPNRPDEDQAFPVWLVLLPEPWVTAEAASRLRRACEALQGS